MNDEILKGEKKMKVRKAETLQTIDELTLSEKTMDYVKRNKITVEKLILQGRYVVYRGSMNNYSTASADFLEYSAEVAKALDEAGFINRALNPGASRLFDFIYDELYGEDWYPRYSTPGFYMFLRNSKVYMDPVVYESIVTEELYARVKELVRSMLGNDMLDLITKKGKEEFGKHREQNFKARSKYAEFKEKIKHMEFDWLPKLDPDFELGKEKDAILFFEQYKLIKELKDNPYFKFLDALRQAKHNWELILNQCLDASKEYEDVRDFANYAMEHGFGLPSMIEGALERYDALLRHEKVVIEKMQEYGLSSDYNASTPRCSPDTELCEFDLSARLATCLSRAGINTIGDVLRRDDPMDFYKIRNFGTTSALELEKVMHDAGFFDFRIVRHPD